MIKVILGLALTVILSSLAFGMLTTPVSAQVSGPSNPNANTTTAYQILSTNSHNVLTVKTDLPSYNQGDTIVITGHVNQPDSNTAITLKIVNPSMNLVAIVQFVPASDGSFTKTFSATGSPWTDAGTYTITAQYGLYTNATTQFHYSGGNGESVITNAINATYALQSGNQIYNIPYIIKGGSVNSMNVLAQQYAFETTLSTNADGSLTVTLPRSLIDAKSTNGDISFIVMVSGTTITQFSETTNPTVRILSIPFHNGDTKIDIVGTKIGISSTSNSNNSNLGCTDCNNAQQIQLTSGGTLKVGLSTDPANPITTNSTQLKINFMNKQDSIQQHIDYKVSIIQGSNQVFGSPLTHTALGSISIPTQFQNSGTYQIIIEVDGILFQPIPPETATFSILASGPSQNQTPQPTPIPTPQPLPSTPPTNEIDIASGAGGSANAACVAANNCFAPNPLIVAPGTTVTWKNTDAAMHVVCSGKVTDAQCGTVFEEDSLKPGKTFQFTFADAGTYDYFCSVHPWMTGQVIVGQGGTNYVFTMTPTGLRATVISPTAINLSWFAPTQNYGKIIIGYKIESIGIGVVNTNSTSTSYTVTNLNTGTPYTFRVSTIYSDNTTTDPSSSITVIPSAQTSGFTPTPQDIQNINQAKANQTIAAEVNVGNDKAETTSIDNNVSVQTTNSTTPDSLNVSVSAPSQTGPKVIAFNLNATTINVANLKDLGVMYDGKLIQPAPNMDAILHAKSTDNPSFAIVVTQSGIQVLVLVPHFSTHTITLTNMSKVISSVPEFPLASLMLLIAILPIILISRMKH